MKRFVVVAFAALALSACQSTGGIQTASDVTAKVCPPLNAALVVLENSPTVSDKLHGQIAEIHPIVRAVCTVDAGAVTVEDLRSLEDVAIPMIISAVVDSQLDDKQKNAVILSAAVAQAVLANWR